MVERLLPIADLFGWVPDVIDWLGGAAEWLVDQPVWAWGELSTTARASVVLVVLGIALGFGVRKARLRLLARSPRVQITEFTWTGAEEKGRDGLWATSLFREQLSLLQTDPLDPLPERSPSAPLVDIVEGVSQGVTQKADFGKMAGRLFRAIWPAAAYEVWGTLRPLAKGKDRISVQLVDRARGNTTLVSDAFADDDWSSGARRAAMAVAGGLYPKIAMKHRGPWAEWRNAIPAELLGHYHDAQAHETNNRLAQAMGAYHEALKTDPLNPELRLKIAMLQERLALDLDAWVTYLGIVDEVNDNAWRNPQRHTRLIALYRLAILLGNGRIAVQWMKIDDDQGPTLRDRVRTRRRSELATALQDDPLLTGRIPTKLRWRNRVAAAPAARLRDALLECADRLLKVFPTTAAPDGRSTPDMDLVLKLMSLQRLEDLDAWLRARPPLWRHQWAGWRQRRPRFLSWFSRRDLSRSSVRVSKRLARVQVAAGLQAHAERNRKTLDLNLDISRLTSSWPFPVAGLDPLRRLVRWLAPRRRLADGRADSWQLHYNAACLIAAALPAEATPPDEQRERFVESLVDEFEEYAHRAGTERVAAQADWVAFDDPDLAGLNESPAFRRWASHHVPRELPEKRPNRSIDVERFTARMIHQAACESAHVWQGRAGRTTTTRDAFEWWSEERAAWLRLWIVCREKHSWQQRLAGLEALERWRRSHGLAEMDLGHESRDQAVTAKDLDTGLFAAIAEQVGGPPTAPPERPDEDAVQDAAEAAVLGWLQDRVEETRAAHEGDEPRYAALLLRNRERREALRAAKIWRRLADALEAELKERPVIGQRGSREELLGEVRKCLPGSYR